MTFGESLPALLTRNALEAISVRSSPLPASVGYTVATRGYSFREGQPAGPVIEAMLIRSTTSLTTEGL
jgi:hypothetical protein